MTYMVYWLSVQSFIFSICVGGARVRFSECEHFAASTRNCCPLLPPWPTLSPTARISLLKGESVFFNHTPLLTHAFADPFFP